MAEMMEADQTMAAMEKAKSLEAEVVHRIRITLTSRNVLLNSVEWMVAVIRYDVH